MAVARASDPGRARLVGLDVARCLALLGMVATHVLVKRDAGGELTTIQWVAGGRSSALFAVLLGVSMALVTGDRRPHRGGGLGRDVAALALRGVLVAAVGLLLGSLETGIAVILTYYGVLIWLALPFVALRARTLLVLAVAWAGLVPVLVQPLRADLPARRFENPDWTRAVDEPGRLLGELLLTGYYPAVAWTAYALLGMGLGRLDLRRPAVAARVAVVGVVVALGAIVASTLLTRAAGFSPDELDGIATGMFGQTPPDQWRWLLVVAPHSTTPFDLLQTGGSAAAVIGTCLLLVALLGWVGGWATHATAVLFGAGTMTLSLYSLHVVMRTEAVWPAEEPGSFRWHLLVLVWTGAVFVALGRRGPLEWLVGWLPRRVRG